MNVPIPMHNVFKRGIEQMILIHGSFFVLISRGNDPILLDTAQLALAIARKPRPLLLLASPYISTFIHNTIHLKPKELTQADQQILGVSSTPNEYRDICSFALTPRQAITVHSHLRQSGRAFLKNAQSKRTRIRWKPAIAYLVEATLEYAHSQVPSSQSIRFFFHDEVLQIIMEKSRPPHIALWNFWQPTNDFETQKATMEQLLSAHFPDLTPTTIDLQSPFSWSTDATALLRLLVFPSGRRQQVKSTKRPMRKDRLGWVKKVTPLRVLVLSTFLFLALAVTAQWKLTDMEAERLALSQSITRLETVSHELSAMAQTEREYYKLCSFYETLGEMRTHPRSPMDRLTQILPETTWISSVTFEATTISLELLDRSESKQAELIDLFNQNIGKAFLENSLLIEIDGTPLKKYRFTINPSPDKTHEKLDKQ